MAETGGAGLREGRLPRKPLAERIASILADLRGYDPERVILFGSAARGEADAHSDLDFLVIKRTDQPFLQRLKEVALRCRDGSGVDFFVYTPEEVARMRESESPFLEAALRDGKVLYEK